MQGRQRTARPETTTLEAGTYQMKLVGANVSQGMPAPQYLKKGKTQEESAYAQMSLIWEDEEGAQVRDSFLKMPEYLEFSEDNRYKSKFQKRVENMLNKQLDDNAGEKITILFDFIESWDELKEAIKELENERPVRIEVKSLQWEGREMFGAEWLVTVGVNDRGYNEITAVAPLPKRRGAQPAPAAQAPQQQAPKPPARPAPAPAPAPADDGADMPF